MSQVTYPKFSNMQPVAEDLQLIVDSLRTENRNRITKDGIFNPGITGKISDYLSAGTNKNSLKIKPFVAYTQNGNRIEISSTWDNLFPTGNIISVNADNLVNDYINIPVWKTYTKNYTNLDQSSTEQSLVLTSLGKGSILHGVKLRTNTIFASASQSNIWVSIGTSTDPEKFLPETLVSDSNASTNLSVMNLMYSIDDDTTTDIIITFKSDNANLNNLTNGALTVNLCIANLSGFDNQEVDQTDGGTILTNVVGQWNPSTLYYIIARYKEDPSDSRVLKYTDNNGNVITTTPFNARLTTNYDLMALRKSGSALDASTLDDVKLGEVLTDINGDIYAININGTNSNTNEPYTQYLTIPGYRWATEIDAAQIADGSVSNTQFQYLNTLTGNVQNQLNGKASLGSDNTFTGNNTFVNQINGDIKTVNGFTANATPTPNNLLVLDENGKVPADAISESTIASIGNFYTVSSGVLTNGRSSFLSVNTDTGDVIVNASDSNPLVLNYPDGSVEKLTTNNTISGIVADGYYYLVKEKNGNFVLLPTSGGTKATIPTITSGNTFVYGSGTGTVLNPFESSTVSNAFNGNITTATKLGQVTYKYYNEVEEYAGLPDAPDFACIEVDYPTSVVPTGFSLCFRISNELVCTPKNWELQGSNDDWETSSSIYVATNSSWNENEIKTFPLSTSSFTKFRIVFDVSDASNINNYIAGEETPAAGTTMPINCYYFQIYATDTDTTNKGSITEGYTLPTGISTGSYHLDISKKPYIGYKYNGTTWIEQNYVKLGFVQLVGYSTVTESLTVYPVCYNTFTISDQNYVLSANSPLTFNHNLGIIPNIIDIKFKCKTANNGYTIGETVSDIYTLDAIGLRSVKNLIDINVLNITLYPAYTTDKFYIISKDTSDANYHKLVEVDGSKWQVIFYCSRGW